MARETDPTQAVGAAPALARGHGRPYLTHDRPLFFAHRGGSLLAPENTLVAFKNGLYFGADALELDVHLSRDGELMVLHDPTVERTTNGVGAAILMTRAELQILDAGYHFTPDGGRTFPFRGQGISIPTLREVLTAFPAVRVNIELKENNPLGEERMWALAQELGVEDRILVASSHLATLVRFRRLSVGRIATSASPPEIRNFVLAALTHTTGWLRPAYDALQVPETWRALRIVSPATVALAHRLGLALHVWTVDDRPTMDRLLAWEVDGLMSDRPDILAEALAAHHA
jgi:glycerophosphoryl diester phosphodiesterase